MQERYRVTGVEATKDGWRIEFGESKCSELPRAKCAIPPQVGELVIFGEGEERRSVMVGGRLYVTSYPPLSGARS